MKRFAAKGKPTIAFAESVGLFDRGQALYYLGRACSEFYVTPKADVNLVGLRVYVPFFKQMLDKLDIEVHMEQRKEYKVNYTATSLPSKKKKN